MYFLSHKTVLVTGASGLIGSHLVDTLMEHDSINVIALSRSEEKLRLRFAKYLDNPNFHYAVQDVSMPFHDSMEPIDVIFHAAGPIAGDIIKEKPVNVVLPNLVGTHNCLEFLRKQEGSTGLRGRMIVFSSATVYWNLTDEDRCVTEADTKITEGLDAQNAPYSQSKRMSEVMARAYHQQYGVDIVVVRFSYIYGHSVFQPNTAFYEFIQKALLREDLIFHNSGFPRRDNLYITDAISGLLCACSKGASGQVYNISSNAELGNFAAIDELAAIISNTVNQSEKSLRKQVRVLFPANQMQTRKPGLVLDNTKLKALGWRPEVSLEVGIRRTIDRYLQEGSNN